MQSTTWYTIYPTLCKAYPSESKAPDSRTRSVMSLAIAGSNEARPGEESVINHVDKNTDATDLKPVGLNLNHVSHGTNRPHDLSDNAKKKLPITITTPIKGDIISRYFHLYEKNALC